MCPTECFADGFRQPHEEYELIFGIYSVIVLSEEQRRGGAQRPET